MTDALWPHEWQHARLPCPSPSPGVCSNSCPSSLWCQPTISSSVTPSPPVFNLPQHQGFSSELALLIRGPEYWSFSFSISPPNEYSGLISFRIYYFDFFAVQETLRSLLQHHNWKALVLWCSAFFKVQFSHLYLATGKAVVLTTQTFVGKAMSLLFNMLSRFVIAFLPRSKCLLISWS